MKKIIIVLMLFVVMLSGCSLMPDYHWECPEEFKDTEEALQFLDTFKIVPESGLFDFYLPGETYNRKAGDCDSLSLLFAHILIYNLHVEDVFLISCTYDGKPHMIVSANGILYESTICRALVPEDYSHYKIGLYISYSDYINLSQLL